MARVWDREPAYRCKEIPQINAVPSSRRHDALGSPAHEWKRQGDGDWIAAAWLVASLSKRRRSLGFWIFLLSNALWIVWGWHDHAHALIGLQIFLALLNIRGAYKNDPDTVPNRA